MKTANSIIRRYSEEAWAYIRPCDRAEWFRKWRITALACCTRTLKKKLERHVWRMRGDAMDNVIESGREYKAWKMGHPFQ